MNLHINQSDLVKLSYISPLISEFQRHNIDGTCLLQIIQQASKYFLTSSFFMLIIIQVPYNNINIQALQFKMCETSALFNNFLPKSMTDHEKRRVSFEITQTSQNLSIQQNKSNDGFSDLKYQTLEQFKQNRLNGKKRLSLSIPQSFVLNPDQKKKLKLGRSSSINQNPSVDYSNNTNELSGYCSTELSLPSVKDILLDFEEDSSFILEKYFFQSKYQNIQKIGEGAHSSVYKCRNILTNEVFAVKISSNIDQEMKNKLISQYKLLHVLNHQNVLKVYELIYNQELQKLYVISQLCQYPDLKSNIVSKIRNNDRSIGLQQKQALQLIHKILKTLQYVQNSGICHRDIKPQNILYNSQTSQIKLIDFDISKQKFMKNDQFSMWTNTGSLHYRAPESFSAGYGQKVDIWSIGITLYELLTGFVPFNSRYETQTIKKIKQLKLNFENIQCTPKTKVLLAKMLQKQQKNRFSFEECLNFMESQQIKYQKDDLSLITQKSNELFDKNQKCKKKYFQQEDIHQFSLAFRMKMEYLNWNINLA